jgi:hypothetical protein
MEVTQVTVPTRKSAQRVYRVPAQLRRSLDSGVFSPDIPPAGRLAGTLRRALDSEGLSRSALTHRARTLGAFLAAALLALWPVMHRPGWPLNHEQGAMFARTAIYAEHLRHLDFLPVWSDSVAWGMGTPLPAFYHRLFYWLSGGLVLIGWSPKDAVIGALLGFMLVGMYGMRFCLHRLGIQSHIANLGAITLIFSTYASTDWLVRGAVAEFTGMMLVPWIIWWALDLVDTGRVGLHIAPIIALAYLAHNIVAFYGLLIVTGAFVVAVIIHGNRLAMALRFVLAIGLTFAALLPLLLVLRPFAADYDIGQIVPPSLLPKNQLHPMGQYFHDPHYRWSTTNYIDYTVGVGLVLWLALALLLIGRAVAFVLRRGQAPVRPFLSRSEVLLAGLVAVLLALQTKTLVEVYDLPGFKFIQFPWRLLAFLTPALILLVFSLAARSASAVAGPLRFAAGPALTVACGLLVFAMVAASPLGSERVTGVRVNAYTKANIENHNGSILGDDLMPVGEYLTVVHDGGGALAATDVYNTYRALAANNGGLQVLSGPCSVREPHRTFEASKRTFALTCTGPGVVALPVSYNSVSTVRLAGEKLRYHRVDRDPRIVVDIPGATSGQLTVDLPTLWRILAGLVP